MSSINSVRNLQILDFSKKNKKIKNLKNGESGLILAFIHTTEVPKIFFFKTISHLLSFFLETFQPLFTQTGGL